MLAAAITDRLDDLHRFCRSRGVRRMAVFGSATGPDFHAGSDIDLLVEFDAQARVSLFDIAEMRAELETLLGRAVDLVTPAILRNPFRARTILRSIEPIYAA